MLFAHDVGVTGTYDAESTTSTEGAEDVVTPKVKKK